MKLRRPGDPREFEVEVISRDGQTLRVRIDGREIEAQAEPIADGSTILTLEGRRLRVIADRRRDSIAVSAGPASFEFQMVAERGGRHAHGLVTPEVSAPMPGKVLAVMVREGERVEAGQPLLVMEAMKMETTLYAEGAAIVKRIAVAPGDAVEHGAVLIELSPAAAPPAPAVDPADR
jgi:3-methylcrotonyl-CoA carboxylase alpha subunit